MSRVATEIYCHACNGYVTIRMDMSINGQHEIKCPNCGHIHYRIVEAGKITGETWNSGVVNIVYVGSDVSYSISSWMLNGTGNVGTSTTTSAFYYCRESWGSSSDT